MAALAAKRRFLPGEFALGRIGRGGPAGDHLGIKLSTDELHTIDKLKSTPFEASSAVRRESIAVNFRDEPSGDIKQLTWAALSSSANGDIVDRF
jgi:hypothetical protein